MGVEPSRVAKEMVAVATPVNELKRNCGVFSVGLRFPTVTFVVYVVDPLSLSRIRPWTANTPLSPKVQVEDPVAFAAA